MLIRIPFQASPFLVATTRNTDVGNLLRSKRAKATQRVQQSSILETAAASSQQ